MDYFRPMFPLNRPPLFHPRMDHFNLMHAPGPFHPSPPPFAMATHPGVSIYLQRPPPPPLHMPMLPGGPFLHHNQQHHQPRDPRKQRPSRRVRQRMKRQPEKQRGEDESKEGNAESLPLASESGYDTTGDCHTPATPLDSPLIANGVSKFATATTRQAALNEVSLGLHSRSDSASSMNLSETSLKKLLKDLHRCDVSISKYQTMLDKNCEEGVRNLQEVFSSLHDRLKAREQDLIQKLNTTKEMAESILQRRKSTASSLRQAAESDQATLEESQLLELKRQIKCFVTDRKVDEEIGTNTYFQADPDDLIRHIMGFGKVSEARHVYTVWEENPLEMINISKEQVLFPPISDIDDSTKPAQESAATQSESEVKPSKSQPSSESASHSITTEKPNAHLPLLCLVSSTPCDNAGLSSDTNNLPRIPKSPKSPLSPPLSATLQPLSPLTSPQSSPARSSSNTQPASSSNRHTYSYRVSATSNIKITPKSPSSTKSGRPWHAVTRVTTKRTPSLNKHGDIPTTKVVETVKNGKAQKDKAELQKERESSSSLPEKKKAENKKEEKKSSQPCSKYSSSELKTIQSRIKDSLRQQGVYLYDPVTGDGPAPTTLGTSGGAGRSSSSSIDISGERGKPTDQNTVLRKKKTPTQLRRERKKRQKERERQQRELEKKSEAQVKQHTEGETTKDSETETNVAAMEGEGQHSDNEEQASPEPTSSDGEAAREDGHCGEQLGDEVSSSDSEPQRESSSNSQSHSPSHSTSSSMEKSIDDDNTTREVAENQTVISECSSGTNEETGMDKETATGEEEEEGEVEEVFLDTISTVDEQNEEESIVVGEKCPSMVMSSEEAISEVKTSHKAGHLATKTKLEESILTTCEKEGARTEGGMQDEVTELEPELKPEE